MNNHAQNINLGIVGAGRIFPKHAAAIEAEGQNFQISKIFDTNTEKSTAHAYREYFVENIDAILSDDKIDTVVILTPSGSHYKIAEQALLNDKNVIVEKPFTLRLEHAYSLIELAEKRNLSINVVKQNRQNPAVQAAKKFIADGLLGTINVASVRVYWCRPQEYYDQAVWRGTWKHDGGVLTNQASHHVDALLWFCGPALKVQSFSATKSAKIESEDTISVNAIHENGTISNLQATTTTRPRDQEGSLTIIGTEGILSIGGKALNRIVLMESQKSFDDRLYQVSEEVDTVYGYGHDIFYKLLYKERFLSKRLLNTTQESCDVLEYIHAAYKAAESGATVNLGDGVFERLGQ
jgi:UDP-N-acetyl-2-amino-2-deoxyglucuronate dehydrogenase